MFRKILGNQILIFELVNTNQVVWLGCTRGGYSPIEDLLPSWQFSYEIGITQQITQADYKDLKSGKSLE